MADISFSCPQCRQPFKASDDMAGELLDCPSCGKPITIPAPEPTNFANATRHVLSQRLVLVFVALTAVVGVSTVVAIWAARSSSSARSQVKQQATTADQRGAPNPIPLPQLLHILQLRRWLPPIALHLSNCCANALSRGTLTPSSV